MHFSRDVFSRPFPLRKAAYSFRISAKGAMEVATYFGERPYSLFASILRLVIVMFHHEPNRKISKLNWFCVTLFARDGIWNALPFFASHARNVKSFATSPSSGISNRMIFLKGLKQYPFSQAFEKAR